MAKDFTTSGLCFSSFQVPLLPQTYEIWVRNESEVPGHLLGDDPHEVTQFC